MASHVPTNAADEGRVPGISSREIAVGKKISAGKKKKSAAGKFSPAVGNFSTAVEKKKSPAPKLVSTAALAV